jgi:hypothetical protein
MRMRSGEHLSCKEARELMRSIKARTKKSIKLQEMQCVLLFSVTRSKPPRNEVIRQFLGH